MQPLGNDRWEASFQVTELGFYLYTVEAWVNHFKSWQRDFQKKVDAEQDVSIDLLIAAQLIEKSSTRAAEKDREQLIELAQFLKAPEETQLKIQLALDKDLAKVLFKYPDKSTATRYERELSVLVSDIVMPGAMDGRRLADLAKRRRPGLRVVLVTGYADGMDVQGGRYRSFTLLRKPCTKEELAAAIETAPQ